MRKIEPRLVEYIDGRLRNNGLAQVAVERKDARLLMRLAAECLVGIREVGGNNRGPLVELIQRTIGEANVEAWCMSLVQSCIAYAELKTGRHSPVYASEHCLTVWENSPRELRVKSVPDLGAIAIWQHGSTSAGHTGVTASACVDRMFSAVEGNTESGIVGGKVERDGGGVYLTRRSLNGAGTMRVRGFLKPFLPVA